MNLLKVQDALKNAADAQLQMEMSNPTGLAPQFLVLSEMKRRKDMRAQQPQETEGTVAEELSAPQQQPQMPQAPPQEAGIMGARGMAEGGTVYANPYAALQDEPAGMYRSPAEFMRGPTVGGDVGYSAATPAAGYVAPQVVEQAPAQVFEQSHQVGAIADTPSYDNSDTTRDIFGMTEQTRADNNIKYAGGGGIRGLASGGATNYSTRGAYQSPYSSFENTGEENPLDPYRYSTRGPYESPYAVLQAEPAGMYRPPTEFVRGANEDGTVTYRNPTPEDTAAGFGAASVVPTVAPVAEPIVAPVAAPVVAPVVEPVEPMSNYDASMIRYDVGEGGEGSEGAAGGGRVVSGQGIVGLRKFQTGGGMSVVRPLSEMPLLNMGPAATNAEGLQAAQQELALTFRSNPALRNDTAYIGQVAQQYGVSPQQLGVAGDPRPTASGAGFVEPVSGVGRSVTETAALIDSGPTGANDSLGTPAQGRAAFAAPTGMPRAPGGSGIAGLPRRGMPQASPASDPAPGGQGGEPAKEDAPKGEKAPEEKSPLQIMREKLAGLGTNAAEDRKQAVNMALLEAGLRIAGSKSPTLMGAIGDAAPAVGSYTEALNQSRKSAREDLHAGVQLEQVDTQDRHFRIQNQLGRDTLAATTQHHREQLANAREIAGMQIAAHRASAGAAAGRENPASAHARFILGLNDEQRSILARTQHPDTGSVGQLAFNNHQARINQLVGYAAQERAALKADATPAQLDAIDRRYGALVAAANSEFSHAYPGRLPPPAAAPPATTDFLGILPK